MRCQPARQQPLDWLPVGTRVRLRAFDQNAMNRGRYPRYAFVFNPATQAYDIDIQSRIAESGLAMWFTVDDESAIIRKVVSAPVDLSGWLLRDSSLTSWYFLPAGTTLMPHDYRVVHVRTGSSGIPDPHDLNRNSGTPINAYIQDGEYVGDAAYLLDHATAMRTYDEYACLSNCCRTSRCRSARSTGSAHSQRLPVTSVR